MGDEKEERERRGGGFLKGFLMKFLFTRRDLFHLPSSLRVAGPSIMNITHLNMPNTQCIERPRGERGKGGGLIPPLYSSPLYATDCIIVVAVFCWPGKNPVFPIVSRLRSILECVRVAGPGRI